MPSTIHASAVLVGARAVLIRGPSGSGKSRLAFDLISAAGGPMRFARLVADDRAELEAAGGRLLVPRRSPVSSRCAASASAGCLMNPSP